jgi:hypothetical protein
LDEEGHTVYRSVPPGKYRLIVGSEEGVIAVDVDVPPAGTRVDVQLR